MAADEPFLRSLYESTREAELAMLPWTETQKQDFVSMQFRAQTTHYNAHYPSATFDVLEIESVPIGRITIGRSDAAINLIDIILAPQYRGKGIGSEIIKDLITEARSTHKQIILFVESFNRAKTLYDRLGFTVVANDQVYFEMRWQPPS
jgi:GNAT superfamily N-acetyltransferase